MPSRDTSLIRTCGFFHTQQPLDEYHLCEFVRATYIAGDFGNRWNDGQVTFLMSVHDWIASSRTVLMILAFCAIVIVAHPREAICQDAESSCSTFKISHDELILVPGEVFAKKMRFCCDTGSSTSLFDESCRGQLGKVISQETALTGAGNDKVNLFAGPRLTIATNPPLIFQSNELVGCSNLSAAKSALGIDDFAILGMDFLKSKVLRLNFDEGIGELKSVRSAESSHLERIQLINGVPRMLIRLPSRGFVSFMVDTGSNGTINLSKKHFVALVEKKKIILTHMRPAADASTLTAVRTGVLESIEFGHHRFHNVRVTESAIDAIGLRLLARFDVELDFPNRVARFTPGARIDQPDRRDRSGFGVLRKTGVTTASAIDANGVAANAGIREGDRVVTINGFSAEKLSVGKIRYMLSEPGVEVTVGIERDGRTEELVLNLSNEPDPFPAKSPHELIEDAADFDR